MSQELDVELLKLCTPDSVKQFYTKYKKSKLDKLRSRGVPTYVELKTSGTTNPERTQAFSVAEVMAIPDYIGGFPAWSSVKGIDGTDINLIRIPMGTDGVTYEMFEKEIERRAIEICSRIQTDKYLFHPLRDIVVIKSKYDDGTHLTKQGLFLANKEDKTRTLAVASIRDAIVQRMLHQVIGPYIEKRLFSKLDRPYPVSFAYRPGKSAAQAAQAVCKHLQEGFIHVLDADLCKFFDSIPRDSLLDRCYEILEDNQLTYSLLKRFICIDRVDYFSYHWAENAKGERIGEKIFKTCKPGYYDFDHNLGPDPNRPLRYRPPLGIPQGGVLSGLLSNLYLHSFDRWMIKEMSREIEIEFSHQISVRYVRYADDFVILTRSNSTFVQIWT